MITIIFPEWFVFFLAALFVMTAIEKVLRIASYILQRKIDKAKQKSSD